MGVMKRMLAMRAGSNGRVSRASFSKTNRSTYEVAAGLPNNELPEVVIQGLSEEVMREFMPIFLERLKGNLVEHQIGHEGDLDDSLKTSVSVSGSTIRGRLKFKFYGRFVDMGVGKGLTLAERQSGVAVHAGRKGLTSRRKPKVWFSAQYAYERARLTEILISELQRIAALTGEQLSDNVTITV